MTAPRDPDPPPDPSPAPSPGEGLVPPGIDTSLPHSARIWNYWLGGKDNYEADRVAGDAYRSTFPGIDALARTSRAWLMRAVRWAATEGGVRQFLDVGAGLPTEHNTHDVAQTAVPDARIVYVDHDPVVLLHVHALLTSTPEGAATYVEADMRDASAVLAGTARTLDLDRPVALVLSDVLGHVPDGDEARATVRALTGRLAPGSLLLLSHGVTTDADLNSAQDDYNDTGAIPYVLRTPEEIARFFEGGTLVEPGVVPMPRWRPGPDDPPAPAGAGWAGVARLGR